MVNGEFQQGFTALEILIAIAIIVILASVAIPSYVHYQAKSMMAQMVQQVQPLKKQVTICINKHAGVMTSCNSGSQGIAKAMQNEFFGIRVHHGVIEALPLSSVGVTPNDNYTLTPKWMASSGVTWTTSGGACTHGLVNC